MFCRAPWAGDHVPASERSLRLLATDLDGWSDAPGGADGFAPGRAYVGCGPVRSRVSIASGRPRRAWSRYDLVV